MIGSCKGPILATNPCISHSEYFWINYITFSAVHISLFPFSKRLQTKCFCYLFAQRIFRAFIISVAVIGLLRHLMNLTRIISNMITSRKKSSFLWLTNVFHSYFIKAIKNSFHGFTGTINPLAVLEMKSFTSLGLTVRDLQAFSRFPNIPRGLLRR